MSSCTLLGMWLDAYQMKRGESWGLLAVHYFKIKIIAFSTVYSIKAVLLVPRTAPGMQRALNTHLKNKQMYEYCV